MLSELLTPNLRLTPSPIESVTTSWHQSLVLPSVIGPIDARTQKSLINEAQGTSAFQEVERELRYFMSVDRLREVSSLANLSVKTISQHSFPKESFKKLMEYLTAEEFSTLFDSIQVKRARLRQIHAAHQDLFYLQTKSPKRELEGRKIERDEPTLQISRDLYNRLLPLACEGSLTKLRLVARGQVFLSSNSRDEIELHTDILLAAGKNRDRSGPPVINPRNLPGSVVELEFGKPEHLESILAGRHSFNEILQDCPLISDQPKEIQRALRTSRIAKDGFDKEAEEAMLKLSSL